MDVGLGAAEARATFGGVEFLEVEVWQAQFGRAGMGFLAAFEGVGEL